MKKSRSFVSRSTVPRMIRAAPPANANPFASGDRPNKAEQPLLERGQRGSSVPRRSASQSPQARRTWSGQVELVPQADELIDVDDLTHFLLDALDENLLLHPCPLTAIREVVAALRRAPPNPSEQTRPWTSRPRDQRHRRGSPADAWSVGPPRSAANSWTQYAARLRANPGPSTMPPPLRNMARPGVATT
jgi:hypothetical protein